MSKVMNTSRGSCSYLSIKFVAKEERQQEDGYKYRPLHKPYIHMNISINVYVYGRAGKM